MAELTDLGDHCSFHDCRQLDFLPVECHFCTKQFCKVHFLPEDHECRRQPDAQATAEQLKKSAEVYSCSIDSCEKSELVPVTCSFCRNQYCLQHRLQQDHQCSAMEQSKEVMPKTKEHVKNIINKSQVDAKPPKRLRNAKAQKTAAKVQLMKLKMSASGNQSVPTDERFFLKVLIPSKGKDHTLNVFVSSKWTMGRVVDEIASLGKVTNKNNNPQEKQLRLFRFQDESNLCSDLGMEIQALLSKEELYNGDTVILKHIDPST